MSNFGQAILTVGGFFIGAAFGFPQLGFLLGSLAGQALFPTQLAPVIGPRISDLNTTTAQVGGPVPIVFGTCAVPGTVLWLGELIETSHTETVGGKGGPTQEVTTYTYNQSIAIGLCEGPILGIQRIWENGKLVYDASEKAEGETEDDFKERVEESAKYAATFVLYLGDEEQEPDPTIELAKGVGSTPAYRGLSYIVYPERSLPDEQARHHPNMRFEVFTAGVAANCEAAVDYSAGVMDPWNHGPNPLNPKNEHRIIGPLGSFNANLHCLDNAPPGDFDPIAQKPGYTGEFATLEDMYEFYEDYIGNPGGYFGYSTNPTSSNAGTGFSYGLPTNYGVNDANENDVLSLYMAFNGASEGRVLYEFPSEYCAYMSDVGPEQDYYFQALSWGFIEGFSGTFTSQGDLVFQVQRKVRAPDNPCHPSEGPEPEQLPGGYCRVGTTILKDANWNKVEGIFGSIVGKALRGVKIGSGAERLINNPYLGPTMTPIGIIEKYPKDPCIPVGHPQYNNRMYWTLLYQLQVAQGKIEGGLSYGVDYPQELSTIFVHVYELCTATGGDVSLASIVRALCARAGLTSVDVADLEDVFISYGIGAVTSARDAIAPLRSVGFFDAVENGKIVEFVKRGKPVVKTLMEEEIGAAPDGERIPPAIQIKDAQDVELPRTIRVKYIARSRNYEVGEQISPNRISTDAVNDVDVELAVTISDDLAAKIAEVLWNDRWVGRRSYESSLDRSNLDLIPSDCVYLPVEGRLERVRVDNSSDSVQLLRRVTLIRDDDGSYVSQAVAAVPDIPGSIIPIIMPTSLILMDIPALRASDDDAGVYAVAFGAATGNTWRGAIISKSISGEEWETLTTITVEGTVGELTSTAPAGITTTWDTLNEITVRLDNGTLSSRSEEDVLNGANAAAIGVDGSWEIIQFVNATLVSGTTYKLTKLLRGRRGTERFVGTRGVGDTFVMLSTGAVFRIPLENAEIGALRYYQAVSSGHLFSEGARQEFTGHGVALLPFSPVDIHHEVEDNFDLTITFKRRDRLGYEMTSGAEIPMSESSMLFIVDIYAASDLNNIVRTINATSETVTYTLAQQQQDFNSETPLVVKIAQVSTVVGRGPSGTYQDAEFNALSGVPEVVYPFSTVTITFGGLFNVNEDVLVTVTYTPRVGTTIVKNYTLLGTGKDDLGDYATQLRNAIDADFPADVVVGGASLVVTATTDDGVLSATAKVAAIGSGLFVYQEHSGVTAGQEQVVFVDLYDGQGSLSPANGPEYSKSAAPYVGGGSIRLQVTGVTQEINQSLQYGREILVIWDFGMFPSTTNYFNGLYPLADKIMDPINGVTEFVRIASQGLLTTVPAVMTRNGVYMYVKDGYRISENYSPFYTNSGSHSSGYKPGVRQIRAPIKAWPSGAKKKVQVTFAHAYSLDGLTRLTEVEDGQTYYVDLDGVPFEVESNSYDAAESDFFMDRIYEELETLIEGSGNYTVTLDIGPTSLDPGVDHVRTMYIERNVVNTDFTVAAGVRVDTTVSAVIS